MSKYYKAFIRVVKSLTNTRYDYDDLTQKDFPSGNIIREPLIIAESKDEVKQILKDKYPQFFQNGKVYEKETKDQAQFFYVVIFGLYDYEKALILNPKAGSVLIADIGTRTNTLVAQRRIKGCMATYSFAEAKTTTAWKLIKDNETLIT